MKRVAGLTYIEVTIASAVFIVVTIIAYGIVMVASNMAGTEIPVRESQVQLQAALDKVTLEVRETSSTTFNLGNFTDGSMPVSAQSWLMYGVARDPDSAKKPKTKNLEPDWQQVVVIAPWFNANLDRGELRRYSIAPVPAGMLTGALPTPSFSTTEIDVGGILLDRSDGTLILAELEKFGAEQDLLINLEVSVVVDTPHGVVRSTYGTSVMTRN